MEEINMNNEYLQLDEMATDGIFAVPSDKDFDMLALRRYCKEKNKPYEELSDEEISFFAVTKKAVI